MLGGGHPPSPGNSLLFSWGTSPLPLAHVDCGVGGLTAPLTSRWAETLQAMAISSGLNVFHCWAMRLNPETSAYILGMGKASSTKATHKLRATLAILILSWKSLPGNEANPEEHWAIDVEKDHIWEPGFSTAGSWIYSWTFHLHEPLFTEASFCHLQLFTLCFLSS